MYELCPNRWIWFIAMAFDKKKIFSLEAERKLKLKVYRPTHSGKRKTKTKKKKKKKKKKTSEAIRKES